jgi:hypothetical protein
MMPIKKTYLLLSILLSSSKERLHKKCVGIHFRCCDVGTQEPSLRSTSKLSGGRGRLSALVLESWKECETSSAPQFLPITRRKPQRHNRIRDFLGVIGGSRQNDSRVANSARSLPIWPVNLAFSLESELLTNPCKSSGLAFALCLMMVRIDRRAFARKKNDVPQMEWMLWNLRFHPSRIEKVGMSPLGDRRCYSVHLQGTCSHYMHLMGNWCCLPCWHGLNLDFEAGPEVHL